MLADVPIIARFSVKGLAIRVCSNRAGSGDNPE